MGPEVGGTSSGDPGGMWGDLAVRDTSFPIGLKGRLPDRHLLPEDGSLSWRWGSGCWGGAVFLMVGEGKTLFPYLLRGSGWDPVN